MPDCDRRSGMHPPVSCVALAEEQDLTVPLDLTWAREFPAEGFLRHRGLILTAAGGAVVEGGLLTLLAPSARSVAPQVTALPSLAAYHDLRWLFTDTQSWLWFGGLRRRWSWSRASALDVTLLRLAWPRGVPRPRTAAAFVSCAALTVLAWVLLSAGGHAGVRRRGAAVLLAVPRRVPAHARHRRRAQPRRGESRPGGGGCPRRARCCWLLVQLRRGDRRRRGDHAPARRAARSSVVGPDRPGQRQGLVRRSPSSPRGCSRAPTSRCPRGCCSACRSRRSRR